MTKELSDTDVTEIAFEVRSMLEAKFGEERTKAFLSRDTEMIIELARVTYRAIRKRLDND